jgi:aspartate carbamoyltransferase catalytic subunit
LPRVNELDASFDTDRRAVYFQQAAYGVPVRMALISLMLHLHKNKSLHKFSGGFAKPDHPVYVQPIGTGVHCHNKNCITRDPAESQYAASKFYVIDGNSAGHRLRCVYCEADIDEDETVRFVTADTTRKTFSPGLAAVARAAAERLRHFVIFASEADAVAAGFAPREAGAGKVRAG